MMPLVACQICVNSLFFLLGAVVSSATVSKTLMAVNRWFTWNTCHIDTAYENESTRDKISRQAFTKLVPLLLYWKSFHYPP